MPRPGLGWDCELSPAIHLDARLVEKAEKIRAGKISALNGTNISRLRNHLPRHKSWREKKPSLKIRVKELLPLSTVVC